MSRKRKSNARFDALRSKPPLFWVKFAAFFSLVGFVAYQSATHAIANIAWQQNPDLALRFVPDHPLALSLKADMQFAESQSTASLAKVERLAKRSLQEQPLNAVAVRLLGYVADARGETARARELMMLAHRISRRDFGTQLWLIEDAVARGDNAKALHHYDIAMRTTPISHQILYPTLVGALENPEVRKGLGRYIRQSPPWLPGFLRDAIGTAENPANVADMLVKAGGLPKEQVYAGMANVLLNELADKSNFPAFRQYYRSLPGSRAAALQSAAFNKDTVNVRYPAAGWQILDNQAGGGAFLPANRSGQHSVTIFANSGERGELMRKYLFLKPGNYRFSASYGVADASPDAELRWDLRCLPTAEAGNSWFRTAAVQNGRSATVHDFTIGSDCPHQMLALQLAGGSGQAGTELTVRSVDIVRR